MSEVTQTARLAAIYAIGIIIERAASFIMLPVYTRYLTTTDYGTIELLMMTTDIFSMIAGAGLATSIFRFYSLAEDQAARRRVISTASLMFVAFFTLAGSIGLLSSPLLAKLVLQGRPLDVYYFYLIFIGFFLQAFVTIPVLFIQAQQRPILFVIVNTLKLGVQLSLNIYFVAYRHLGVLGVLYSLLITYGVFGVALIAYTLKNVGLAFEKPLAKELLSFGGPLIIASLASFVITFSDRYFIKTFASLADVGVYSLSYKFGFILLIIAGQPIFRVWEPLRFQIAKHPDVQGINRRVFMLANMVLISCALGIALFCRDLLRIMSAPEFWNAYKIVPIILVAYLIQAWTDFGNFGIQWSGKTRYLAGATLASAVAVIALSFALIPTFGTYGAAWATLLAFVVRFAIVWHYSQREFTLDLAWSRILITVALASGIYALGALFLQENIIASLAYNASLFAVFAAGVFLLPILEPNDRRVVVSFFRNPVGFFRAGKI